MGNVGGTLSGAIKETGNVGARAFSTINNPLLSTDYLIIFGVCLAVIILGVIIGSGFIKSPEIGPDGFEITNCGVPETRYSRAGAPIPGLDGKCYKEVKDDASPFKSHKPFSKGVQWLILAGICFAISIAAFFGLQYVFWMIRNPVGASATIGVGAMRTAWKGWN
jgi:hypothetical protein